MTAKRRNTYFVLMGCGAAALLVDRVFLSGSESTPAKAVAGEGQSNRPSTKPHHLVSASAKLAASGATAAVASIPELPFPRNLPAFDVASPIRDIFSPNTLEEHGNAAVSSAPRGNDRSGAGTTPAQFASKHRLHAVLLHDEMKVAIVDGASLQEEDELDGCRVVRISATFVEFSCKSGSSVLNLSKPIEKTHE
ncbi:MAG: hypothetical protein HY287_00360 [Planctomycetes bacterium]|nr:hypothetical protein [Planctomycetota bacterium]MBI3832765.1 hypothetical protein [Planctomycetota bacterium]